MDNMNDISLEELIAQMNQISIVDEDVYTIDNARKELKDIIDYFQSQEYFEEALTAVSDARQLPADALRDYGCFYVPEELSANDLPEWMTKDSLGFCHGRYLSQSGRWVYPVKDNKGAVMGFLGWDKFVEPKYLDSKNYGYKAKIYSLWGMEELPTYYRDKKPVFITEGVVCAFWLRTQGFHSLAMLGSNMSPYVRVIVNRLGSRAVVIADNDEAGYTFIKRLKYSKPKALMFQARYGKDVDGMRLYEDGRYLKEMLIDLNNMGNPFYTPKMFIRS